MNKKFGFLSVVTILFIAAVLFLTMTDFVFTTDFFVDGYGEERIENLLEHFEDGNTIAVMHRVDEDELSMLSDRIIDSPKLFWVDLKHNALSVGNVSVIVLREKYDDVDRKWEEIEYHANIVLKSIIDDGMSEYDKVLAIYDWICESVQYEAMTNDEDQDIYGALILKKARCAGYAKLFTYMLDKVGVDSEVISGTAIDESGESIAHAWNLVTIDEELYYFDITWDDDDDGDHTYEWFGITTDEFKKSHFPSDSYGWEKATSDKANYYIKNDMYMDRYSASEFAKQITSQGKTVYLKCANNRILNEVISAFGDKNELQKIMKMAGIQYIDEITYYENEKTNCIKVIFS